MEEILEEFTIYPVTQDISKDIDDDKVKKLFSKQEWKSHKRILQPKSGEITVPNTCSANLNDMASQRLKIVDISPLQIKTLQNLEKNGLYRAAGYLLASIQKRKMHTFSNCI